MTTATSAAGGTSTLATPEACSAANEVRLRSTPSAATLATSAAATSTAAETTSRITASDPGNERRAIRLRSRAAPSLAQARRNSDWQRRWKAAPIGSPRADRRAGQPRRAGRRRRSTQQMRLLPRARRAARRQKAARLIRSQRPLLRPRLQRPRLQLVHEQGAAGVDLGHDRVGRGADSVDDGRFAPLVQRIALRSRTERNVREEPGKIVAACERAENSAADAERISGHARGKRRIPPKHRRGHAYAARL